MLAGPVPGQSATSNTSVRTRGVSSTTSTTVPSCQLSLRSSAAPATDLHTCGSRGLPEARLVLVTQLEAAHPLRALPEVQVRHQQAGGAAVLGIERLAVIAECNPGLTVGHVLDRQIGGIAAVTESQHVRSIVLDLLEQRVERDPLPRRVELRPAGHAVDVLGQRLGRKCVELLPAPALRLLAADNRERPLLERCMRGRARREDREVVRHVLPRRQSIGLCLALPAATEITGNGHQDPPFRAGSAATVVWSR